MTDPSGTKRRLLGLARLAAVLIGAAVFATLFTQSLQDNDSYASILSGIATIVTLFIGLFDHLRRQDNAPPVDEAAEDLRLRLLEHWRPELHRRVQRFPHDRTIPLEWRKYGGSGEPSPLDGRFEGDPDQAAARLAERFDQPAAKKRMVVLGEPGAGKSFIAITLVVGLLDRWTGDQPVAVYLPLSSWDPLVEGLDNWIIRSVANDHYSGDQRTPRKLLTARRLLPVIDGLDELPEHLRRLAVRRINETLTGDRMLVVTCRTTEYEEVLAGGAPVLLKAPTVEVRPVMPADVVARLAEVPAWADVLRHVRSRPNGPLASALTTPLMLSLFSAVYLERDPADLLDETKFGSRHAVEDHLVDMRLETAYPAEATGREWSSGQARRWLTYLAWQMHRYDERDITWRKLAHRCVTAVTPLIVTAAVAGLGVLALSSALPSVYYWSNQSGRSVRANALSLITESVPLTSMLIGVVATATWLAFRRHPDDRAQPDRGRRMRGFHRGLVVGLVTVLASGYVLILADLGSDLRSFVGVVRASAMTCATVALALLCGAVIGLHEMLVEHAEAKRSAPATRDGLRRERTSTLVAASAAGLVVGVLSIPTAVITTEAGAHLGQRLARTFGLPTTTDLHLPSLGTHLDWPLTAEITGRFTLTGAVIAILFALVLAATRIWSRLVAARVKLACTGRLPWRLRKFVADATERGLLRRAGAAHQFGHVLLQERLVATAVDDAPANRLRWQWAGALSVVALLLVAIGGAAWLGRPVPCRTTNWAGADSRMTRTTAGPDTACFAYVDQQEWETDLRRDDTNAQVLADIKAQQPKTESGIRAGSVVVAGEFDLITPTSWHDILVGVASAQQVSTGSIDIRFVFADLEGKTGPETADLLRMYLSQLLDRARIRGGYYNAFAVADLNIASSRRLGGESRTTQIVAFNETDFDSRAKEQGDQVVLNWLNSPKARAEVSAPPADALVDEAEADLCTDLAAARRRSLGFDMRGTKPTTRQLNEMAACGGASLLVDPADAEALRALPDRPSEVKINYVSDLSATIAPDCEQALGPNPSADSVKACVAVVAANESYRVTVEQLPDPGRR